MSEHQSVVMPVTSTAAPETEIHGIRLVDWIASSGAHESTVYRLLKIADVTPEKRRIPGGSHPVRFLLPEHLAVLNPLLKEFHQGASLRELEQRALVKATLAKASQATANLAEPPQSSASHGNPLQGLESFGQPRQASENLANTSQALTKQDKASLVTDLAAAQSQASSNLAEAGQVTASIDKLATSLEQVVVRLLDQAPVNASTPVKPNPLETAKRLKEAAEVGVPLTNNEFARLVGVTPGTARSWPEQVVMRPGLIAKRQKIKVDVGNEDLWWTVVDEARQTSASLGQVSQGTASLEEHRQSSPRFNHFGLAAFTETTTIWGQMDVALPAAKGPALPSW